MKTKVFVAIGESNHEGSQFLGIADSAWKVLDRAIENQEKGYYSDWVDIYEYDMETGTMTEVKR